MRSSARSRIAVSLQSRGARSGEPNWMRRLESLSAAVGEEDLQRRLASGAQPECDERIVAHRGCEPEVADVVATVEDFQSSEIERFGLLDEGAIAQGQARATGMADGHLNVDQLIATDPPLANQLRDVDPGRAKVRARRAGRQRCVGASALAFDDGDALRARRPP